MFEMQKMMATMSAQMAMIAKPTPVVPLQAPLRVWLRRLLCLRALC